MMECSERQDGYMGFITFNKCTYCGKDGADFLDWGEKIHSSCYQTRAGWELSHDKNADEQMDDLRVDGYKSPQDKHNREQDEYDELHKYEHLGDWAKPR